MSENGQAEIDDRQDQSSNTLAWFLTGAVIGATAALLYAPKSGKETRQFLTEKAQQGKEAVTETSDTIVEASRDMFERGRKLVEDAAELFERGRKMVRG
jgi:gas vesicle protein